MHFARESEGKKLCLSVNESFPELISPFINHGATERVGKRDERMDGWVREGGEEKKRFAVHTVALDGGKI
jgi:hypothetical protein